MDAPLIELKAIQTVYDGQHFRSRLEARWAAFFNALQIPYSYEPEGFDLNGLKYLPDFWLPDHKFFFEVKGPFTDNKGPEKALALATASRRMVFLFGEIPKFDHRGYFDSSAEGTVYYPDNGVDYSYMWCRKKCCGKYGIQFQGRSERIVCNCSVSSLDFREATFDHPSLLIAYMSARHHRFEGGK